MENSPGDSGFSNSRGSGYSRAPGRSLCRTGPRYQESVSLQTYDGPGTHQFSHCLRTYKRSIFPGWLRNHQFEAGSGRRRDDGGSGDPFAEGIGEEIILETQGTDPCECRSLLDRNGGTLPPGIYQSYDDPL